MASLTLLLPLNANDRLLIPPLTIAPGHNSLIFGILSKKLIAYFLCSSIPVAIVNMFGSKIISVELKSSFLVNKS